MSHLELPHGKVSFRSEHFTKVHKNAPKALKSRSIINSEFVSEYLFILKRIPHPVPGCKTVKSLPGRSETLCTLANITPPNNPSRVIPKRYSDCRSRYGGEPCRMNQLQLQNASTAPPGFPAFIGMILHLIFIFHHWLLTFFIDIFLPMVYPGYCAMWFALKRCKRSSPFEPLWNPSSSFLVRTLL